MSRKSLMAIAMLAMLLLPCVAEARKFRPAMYQDDWVVFRFHRYRTYQDGEWAYRGSGIWELVPCDDLDADTDQKIWERYQRGEFQLRKLEPGIFGNKPYDDRDGVVIKEMLRERP